MSEPDPTTADDGLQPPATFVFYGGLAVSPDDTDNPDNHVVLHPDAGTKVSFVVVNAGTVPGHCEVSLDVDGAHVADWTSEEVPPGGSASPPEVKGIGRYPSGAHRFRACLSPEGGGGEVTNDVNVG